MTLAGAAAHPEPKDLPPLRAPARGKFITFEGGEGAGKSTQVKRLVRRLHAAGIDAMLTREPGGSPLAEQLRAVLLGGQAAHLGPLGEALLFCAARIDHIDSVIVPALNNGLWVVCDRFSDSTAAYQGALGQIDSDLMASLERVTVGRTRPDLTILIDVPPGVGLERARTRRASAKTDRFEAEAMAFHEALRTAFLTIAKREPARVCVVNGNQPEEPIADAIWQTVTARLGLLSLPVAP